MGCGTSISDNEVKSPNKQTKLDPDLNSQQPESSSKHLLQRKNVDLKQIKTQKSIMHDPSGAVMKQEQPPSKGTNARIFLFGESKDERKIIQFQALPTPHIEILLSRTHSLPPVKYQPTQIILEQSQQLTSSNLYISNSHPPYNYMFSTFIKSNTILLCGGVNFNFDNVSNQAFLYYVKDEPVNLNTPHKNEKNATLKKQRRIGNNLMGSKFERLAFMRSKRYSHMGVYFRMGKLGYVYVFGGRTENDETLSKCQKYSVEENKWTDIAPMSAPRSTGFTIIVNKKIYVFGGYTKENKRSKKIERYNPTFDSWDVLNVKLHKGIETGIILPCPSSSQILIVGGNVEFGALKSVIRVNFQNETYWWDSDLKKERLLQKGIALLEENSAYVLGGDFQDTIQKYSYKDKTWKLVTNLTYSECVSPDDINAFTLAQQTVELTFEADNPNNALTNKSQKQGEPTLSSQCRYVFGSDDYPCIYEINTAKWVLKKKNVPMSLRLRCHMSVAKIKDGKIFIGGGIDCYYEKASRAAYIYYPGTNKAIQVAKMKQKKYAFAACPLNNFVYIFGGQDGKEGKVLSYAQKYDVTQDKWVQLPQMPQQRTFGKAIVSPGNKILLIGGTDSVYQTVYRIDIFDPQTNTFSTFNANFPLSCQIKFVDFTGNVVTQKKRETTGDFQFLELNSSVKIDEAGKAEDGKMEKIEGNKSKIEETASKVQNISNVKAEQISQYCMIVFGYNSYKKEDQCCLVSMSSGSPDNIAYDQKSYRLYPYCLTFSIRPPADKQKGQPEYPTYYFISSKGVFKWDESTKQISTQIVINQMHMLQMPLDKFAIA